jgi:hypothetical protein
MMHHPTQSVTFEKTTDLPSRLYDRRIYGHVARCFMLAVLLWSFAFVHPLKAVTYTFGTGQTVPVASGIYNFASVSQVYSGLTFSGDTQILGSGNWLEMYTAALTISSGLSYNLTLEGNVSLKNDQTWTNNGSGSLSLARLRGLERTKRSKCLILSSRF